MFPYINFMGKHISTYGIMALFGALLSGFISCKIARKRGFDDNDMIVLLLISAIGVFIGSHLLYSFTHFDYIVIFITHINKIKSFQMLIDCLLPIFGGSVFYGGLIGGMIFGYIYLKKKKLPVNDYTDMVAPIIPLFHFFGRIGCFLVGCCYGVESKIGFTYEHSLNHLANHVNRFPIQLVEATFNLILFILLYNLLNKNKLKSKLLGLYLFLYSIGRFIFEFFRGDEYRGFIFGLSTSQFISILVLVFSLFLLLKKENDLS